MRIFFLDCQTTGTTPSSGSLLEIAWGFDEKSIESCLVKVPDGIPGRIQTLTGITEADLENALEPAEVAQKLRAFVKEHGELLAVIHFAKFERPFLEKLFGDAGIPFEVLCTHELAKRVVPQLPSRGLRGLAGFFGFSKQEQKRARSHIEATIAVWKGLCEKMGASTGEEAKRWLLEPAPKRARGFIYPLEKFKRLQLPDKPGVYRFLNSKGEVLYVGKATSLKDRVNSYFRGRKGRDSRKLEMLTQAWDLSVTECGSILEASMLESDLIKELNPPYNLALKSANKSLVFYSPDFLSVRFKRDSEHPLGPFPAFSAVEQLWTFCQSARAGAMSPEIFYDPVEADVLEEAYSIFRREHGFSERDCGFPRKMLAFGMWILKNSRDREEAAEEIEELEEKASEEAELSPEEVAERLERLMARAAADYRRSKAINRLINADIAWESGGTRGRLRLRNGELTEPKAGEEFDWSEKGVKVYDRLSVLASEIAKARNQGVRFSIRNQSLQS